MWQLRLEIMTSRLPSVQGLEAGQSHIDCKVRASIASFLIESHALLSSRAGPYQNVPRQMSSSIWQLHVGISREQKPILQRNNDISESIITQDQPYNGTTEPHNCINKLNDGFLGQYQQTLAFSGLNNWNNWAYRSSHLCTLRRLSHMDLPRLPTPSYTLKYTAIQCFTCQPLRWNRFSDW